MSRTTAQATRSPHKGYWMIALMVGALVAVTASAVPAAAADQQATSAQMDDVANRQVTSPATGAYAYSYAKPRHRSGPPHASAQPEQPTVSAPARKGFQDYK
jgi:hypothetical protein